ncbi:MAG: Jag N-terminal domain-containing protein, partial [Candidatus Eiseniibacteriota bacterium]
MNSAVGTGKTLEEAVQDALARLGATTDQVEVRKLEEGSSGLMGTAFRPYRVRATFLPGFGPPPPAPGAGSAGAGGGHGHFDERTAFRGGEFGMAPASPAHSSDIERRERPWERDRESTGNRESSGDRGDRDRGDRPRGGRDRGDRD